MFLNWKFPKLFYGWWIVGAAFLVALFVSGTVVYGFTAIFEPMVDDLGWSYTQISAAASLRGLETGIFAPLTGLLTDRWGPKRLVFGGIVCVILGLVVLSYTSSLALFYVAFFLIALGTSGTTAIVMMTAVANWFRKKVGLASGIVASGFGCSGLMVLVMVRLIDLYDWRVTLLILALSMLILALPLSFLFRHKPEQYGYLPDGQASSQITFDNDTDLSQDVEVEVGVAEAIRSKAFWHIAMAYAFHMAVISAVITHIMPALSSAGITRSISGVVATILPLVSIGGRLGLGWLGDKFERRWVTAGALGIEALGLLCFGYVAVAGTWLLILFLVLFGVGYGGCAVMWPTLSREYFGRKKFGTIFGFMIGVNTIGSVFGPVFAGWGYDNWGSYQSIWFIFAGLALAALITMLTVSPSPVRTLSKIA